MGNRPFFDFLKHIWWWNLLIDFLLVTIGAYFAFQFLTNRAWDNEKNVVLYGGLLLLLGMHSLALGVYAIIRFRSKNYGSGIFLLVHSIGLLVVIIFFISVFLLVGIR